MMCNCWLSSGIFLYRRLYLKSIFWNYSWKQNLTCTYLSIPDIIMAWNTKVLPSARQKLCIRNCQHNVCWWPFEEKNEGCRKYDKESDLRSLLQKGWGFKVGLDPTIYEKDEILYAKWSITLHVPVVRGNRKWWNACFTKWSSFTATYNRPRSLQTAVGIVYMALCRTRLYHSNWINWGSVVLHWLNSGPLPDH